MTVEKEKKRGAPKLPPPTISRAKLSRAKKMYEDGKTLITIEKYLCVTRANLNAIIKEKRWQRLDNEATTKQAQKLVECAVLKEVTEEKRLSFAAVVACKKKMLIAHAAEWAGVRDTLNPILLNFGANAEEDKKTLYNLKLVTEILEKTQAGERRALGITDEVILKINTEEKQALVNVQDFEAIARKLQNEI